MNKRLAITPSDSPDAGEPAAPIDEKQKQKLLWRPETVAHKLDVAVRTLGRWRASGQFPEPDLRMGPKLMWWRPETVELWISRQSGGSHNG